MNKQIEVDRNIYGEAYRRTIFDIGCAKENENLLSSIGESTRILG